MGPETNQENDTERARDGGAPAALQEVLPKTGLVFSERGNLSEILCKPKILPLKSATLLRMEDLDQKARELAQMQAKGAMS
ncbi:BBSome-interacting protein 1 [Hondaea fermentalgiana]|uniref:BBSome-interacting protein 1 n=1 Tax=Hondaea fermentalgiana TaxID=2315210 RepID=A0A2R5G8T4_9STRA|nr:BBSome-interacting protein 1 [Hondaea fermentalgiana]|eukprot:GBG26955.1 BBSome-interacting protein 1 [Hondaea fermentalgiana]